MVGQISGGLTRIKAKRRQCNLRSVVWDCDGRWVTMLWLRSYLNDDGVYPGPAGGQTDWQTTHTHTTWCPWHLSPSGRLAPSDARPPQWRRLIVYRVVLRDLTIDQRTETQLHDSPTSASPGKLTSTLWDAIFNDNRFHCILFQRVLLDYWFLVHINCSQVLSFVSFGILIFTR